MAVPNIFGNVTTTIPLSQLDTNFATPVTLGNTSVALGNTATTLGNLTLTNVTISSTATGIPNSALANSSVTIGNTSVSLGSTATTVGNLTVNNAVINGTVGATTPNTGAFTTLSTTSYVGIGTTTPTTFGAFAVRLGVSNYYGRTVSGAFSDAANSTLEIGHAANVVFFDTESSGVALKVQQNGTVITTTSSTGLAVTGVLSATGVVTFSNYGAGTATFSGAGVISSVSDETWKIKDGVPVDPDAMLKKLEPGYWYYNAEKKETFGTDRQLGFYAQNVNAAIGPEAAPIPESVTTKNEDGTETTTTKPWGYYDRSVLAVTVMSLQKALATIETLTAKVAKLEAA
jgi:hypothetical protein